MQLEQVPARKVHEGLDAFQSLLLICNLDRSHAQGAHVYSASADIFSK